jgi:hypothetical protein
MGEFSRYDLVTFLTSIHLARVKKSLLVGILITANNRLIMRVMSGRGNVQLNTFCAR